MKEKKTETNVVVRTIVKRGVFILAVFFSFLAVLFSPEYLSGSSQTVSNDTILAVTSSLLCLVCCILL